ncbi:ornithine decarboxylase antizyme with +1 programmed ribosomal frameshift Spa1 [Schizosaccharomyces osmophilus]|uniref:Ornithine decarboxylase antizyme n=1 Tax=Schizosaccharomyces osmophilus TaxID=2545709 RepID=A0AAE9W957_9SCHI|nr:ornithine decarboxylase antizyme with +1 programmed ribosomal frameshift Spa1 [Schizosaccharomyces osmophilus]WBW71484.1 ornithine decarboxylase antizyme with +1 programmed ribosomal frameshift Spa1 [Schizosaccharomyces osmophilus]
MAFRNPMYQLSNVDDIDSEVLNSRFSSEAKDDGLARRRTTLAIFTCTARPQLEGQNGAPEVLERSRPRIAHKRQRRRHVPRWISDSFRTCLPSPSGKWKEQTANEGEGRVRNSWLAACDERIGIAEPTNYWHGIIHTEDDNSRTLYLIPETWEDVHLKEGFVAIIDLAAERLRCTKLILFVDKNLSALSYLVKSLHWVGFEPIPHLDCVDHVLFGMEL